MISYLLSSEAEQDLRELIRFTRQKSLFTLGGHVKWRLRQSASLTSLLPKADSQVF